MKLTIKHKQIAIFPLLLVLLLITLVQGCGSENSTDNCTAPFGSSITINPSSETFKTSGGVVSSNLAFDFQVTVLYPDKTPMPKACINISGVLAVPNTSAAYQFFFFPGGAQTPGNVAVNTGFAAQTDDFGQYTFSAVVSAGTSTFFDTITARSGTVSGTTLLTINQCCRDTVIVEGEYQER